MKDNKYFQQALEFIEKTDLKAMANGKHVIDGENLWVNIVDSELRSAEEAKFEAHNRYIDIQIPLSGAEGFGVMDRGDCQDPLGEFNENDDYILYADAIVNVVTRQAGEMIVFAPNDAHAPLIGQGTIHKAIFKVRVVQ